MPVFRSDMGRIAVSVAGITLDSVSWDYMEGGDLTPSMQQYNPGGMANQVAVGGLRTRTDVIVRRVWSDATIAAYIALDNASGIAAMSVSFTPVNADRKTNASSPITYTGVLGPVTRPNYDSSSSALVYLQLTMSPNEVVS